jgi:tRNA threonylcarbamoyladenosine modification (KEOPS) complex  Pcc1 subunit
LDGKATIRLEFPSERQLNMVLEALEPESKRSTTTRSRVIMKKDNGVLVLEIEAKDTVALRAALNAYLRWVHSVLKVLAVLESKKTS